MPYMVTFTINIPPMLAYIPYMDPMGIANYIGQLVPMIQIASNFWSGPIPHRVLYMEAWDLCIPRASWTTQL